MEIFQNSKLFSELILSRLPKRKIESQKRNKWNRNGSVKIIFTILKFLRFWKNWKNYYDSEKVLTILVPWNRKLRRSWIFQTPIEIRFEIVVPLAKIFIKFAGDRWTGSDSLGSSASGRTSDSGRNVSLNFGINFWFSSIFNFKNLKIIRQNRIIE